MSFEIKWIDYELKKTIDKIPTNLGKIKVEELTDNTSNDCKKILFVWKGQTYWTPGTPLD